jgi:ribosomal protein S18 acetylase RimI-like enzyme
MALSWRKAGMDDATLLWGWANDPETRRNSFTRAHIPFGTHVAWLRDRLASDATLMLIFADGERPVGQVRFDVDTDVAEVSIVVAPECRGHGHGRAMLVEALRALRIEHGPAVRPRAAVLSSNWRSLALFRACGFDRVGVERRHGREAIMLERRGTER